MEEIIIQIVFSIWFIAGYIYQKKLTAEKQFSAKVFLFSILAVITIYNIYNYTKQDKSPVRFLLNEKEVFGYNWPEGTTFKYDVNNNLKYAVLAKGGHFLGKEWSKFTKVFYDSKSETISYIKSSKQIQLGDKVFKPSEKIIYKDGVFKSPKSQH